MMFSELQELPVLEGVRRGKDGGLSLLGNGVLRAGGRIDFDLRFVDTT